MGITAVTGAQSGGDVSQRTETKSTGAEARPSEQSVEAGQALARDLNLLNERLAETVKSLKKNSGTPEAGEVTPLMSAARNAESTAKGPIAALDTIGRDAEQVSVALGGEGKPDLGALLNGFKAAEGIVPHDISGPSQKTETANLDLQAAFAAFSKAAGKAEDAVQPTAALSGLQNKAPAPEGRGTAV